MQIKKESKETRKTIKQETTKNRDGDDEPNTSPLTTATLSGTGKAGAEAEADADAGAGRCDMIPTSSPDVNPASASTPAPAPVAMSTRKRGRPRLSSAAAVTAAEATGTSPPTKRNRRTTTTTNNNDDDASAVLTAASTLASSPDANVDGQPNSAAQSTRKRKHTLTPTPTTSTTETQLAPLSPNSASARSAVRSILLPAPVSAPVSSPSCTLSLSDSDVYPVAHVFPDHPSPSSSDDYIPFVTMEAESDEHIIVHYSGDHTSARMHRAKGETHEVIKTSRFRLEQGTKPKDMLNAMSREFSVLPLSIVIYLNDTTNLIHHHQMLEPGKGEYFVYHATPEEWKHIREIAEFHKLKAQTALNQPTDEQKYQPQSRSQSQSESQSRSRSRCNRKKAKTLSTCTLS